MLSPAIQAFVDAALARNRTLYGDLRMEDPPEGGDKTTADADKAKDGKAKDGKDDAKQETAEEKAARLERELDEAKRNSRKHEERAKANKTAADELAKVKQQGMSETEKAVDEAKRTTRAEVLREVGEARARDRFVALAAGKVANPADVVDDLNLARFVGEDGSLDEPAIAKAVERLAGVAPAKQDPKFTPVDRGPRGGSRPAQLTADDIKRLSPTELVKAQDEGRLDDHLGIKR